MAALKIAVNARGGNEARAILSSRNDLVMTLKSILHCRIASCSRHTQFVLRVGCRLFSAFSSEVGAGSREENALFNNESEFERKTGTHFC
jgi:hypothetical protein